MGTINERKRADGTKAYSAQISLMRDGQIVHRESRTFNDRGTAKSWIEKRETELAKPGGLDAAKIGRETLGDAIDKYVATSRKKIGRTKEQVLASLKDMDVAKKRCAEITRQTIIDLAEELQTGRKPQTVNNYLSHLQAMFAVAKPAWGFALEPAAMNGAMEVCKRLGLIRKSEERDRRPTLDELAKLMKHFGAVESRRVGTAPMQKIVVFAIFSTRRQEEITRTRLVWPGQQTSKGL